MTYGWLGQSLAIVALLGSLYLSVATVIVLPVAWVAGWVLARAGRPVRVLRFAGRAMGTLWAFVAALFGVGQLLEELARREYRKHHYALPQARTMEGLALPAGTWVDLDPAGALTAFRPPHGNPVAVAGIRWTETVQWRGGEAVSGLPLDPVVRSGIPCAAGRFVTPWSNTGGLQTCTLDGDLDIAGVPCSGGGEVDLAEQPPGTLAACRLRVAHRIGDLTCAAGVMVRFDHGALTHCTLAEVMERGGVLFTPGTLLVLGVGAWGVVYAEGPQQPPLVVQGVPMPGGRVSFLRDGTVQQVRLPAGQSVPLGRGRLAELLRYGPGGFERGTLAAPLMVDGRMRDAGEEVGRQDLGLD